MAERKPNLRLLETPKQPEPDYLMITAELFLRSLLGLPGTGFILLMQKTKIILS